MTWSGWLLACALWVAAETLAMMAARLRTEIAGLTRQRQALLVDPAAAVAAACSQQAGDTAAAGPKGSGPAPPLSCHQRWSWYPGGGEPTNICDYPPAAGDQELRVRRRYKIELACSTFGWPLPPVVVQLIR